MRVVLAVGLALEAGAVVALGLLPGADGTPVPALVLWAAAWAGHLLVWRRLAAGGAAGGTERALLWATGVGMRLALLPLLPHFSDDVWRYLWDGWVALHGVNPFVHPPVAEALDGLATAWRPRINHPSVPTIYPPGAQLVFHALALLGPSVLLFKAAWTVADLGVAWLVDRIARKRGDRSAVPLWLWLGSPLVVVEVAWSGHLEPLALLPALAAVALADGAFLPAGTEGPRPGADRRGLAAGALLGLGASIKLAPLAAVPALGRRRGAGAVAAALAVPLLLWLPYSGAGDAVFAGLGEYASRWAFNGALFPVAAAAAGEEGARWIAVAVPAGVAVAAAAGRWRLDRALLRTAGAALLLSPTIHPWYLLWVLPFAALERRRPWIWWTATVFLTYAGLDVFRATGVWPHPPALAAAVHLPVLVLLALDALGRLPGGPESQARRPGRQEGGGEEEGEGHPGGQAGGGQPDGGHEQRRPQDQPDGGAAGP